MLGQEEPELSRCAVMRCLVVAEKCAAGAQKHKMQHDEQQTRKVLGATLD